VNSSFYNEREDGRVEHRAEGLMLVLALLVIPAIVLEESSSGAWRDVALVLNLVVWIGFALELAFVLWVSSRRLRTLRAHWMDAAIVAVSFPALPLFLQGARALRLLRLLRFARLAIFGGRALAAARELFSPEGLRFIAPLVAFLVVVAGAAMAAVDPGDIPSVGDGI
jgi:hypothetical protein